MRMPHGEARARLWGWRRWSGAPHAAWQDRCGPWREETMPRSPLVRASTRRRGGRAARLRRSRARGLACDLEAAQQCSFGGGGH
ncbi:hypothetical protein GQ55_1G362300 [Panicum hallii var. hallii]|uniref:Uncharacterized protein n=1 Tax=Panicum hallii var. hallii TaxID=1504633 RepID=A0A2T7FB67_9POAL|nr:hypothetical protein GQ55_1G362300 [Panicum hallii var. hallii]